ncbi:hypothetical protein L209DRAFT_676508, partial [Thermothelomyces heterothallicus CBS 203.75]
QIPPNLHLEVPESYEIFTTRSKTFALILLGGFGNVVFLMRTKYLCFGPDSYSISIPCSSSSAI